MARILATVEPQQSLKYFPHYSKTLLQMNEAGLIETLDSDTANQIKMRAEIALRRSPLSELPFLHTALSQSLVSQKFVRRDLFELVKQRKIGSNRAIQSLLAINAAQNDLDGVMEHLDILVKIQGNISPTGLDTLMQVAMRERGRVILNRYLEKESRWSEPFVEAQIANMQAQNIPYVSEFLFHFLKSGKSVEKSKKLQEKFFEKLVKLGMYEQAYAHWKRILLKAGADSQALIYDGDFLDNDGYAPFNWKVFRGKKFFAEINKGEGLYVSFGDNRERLLTQQVLRLAPGERFKFSANTRRTYLQRQGSFFWSFRCLPTQKVFAQTEIDGATRVKKMPANLISFIFTVPPEKCDAQLLQLRAKSGQYNKRIWAEIKSVEIVHAE